MRMQGLIAAGYILTVALLAGGCGPLPEPAEEDPVERLVNAAAGAAERAVSNALGCCSEHQIAAARSAFRESVLGTDCEPACAVAAARRAAKSAGLRPVSGGTLVADPDAGADAAAQAVLAEHWAAAAQQAKTQHDQASARRDAAVEQIKEIDSLAQELLPVAKTPAKLVYLKPKFAKQAEVIRSYDRDSSSGVYASAGCRRYNLAEDQVSSVRAGRTLTEQLLAATNEGLTLAQEVASLAAEARFSDTATAVTMVATARHATEEAQAEIDIFDEILGRIRPTLPALQGGKSRFHSCEDGELAEMPEATNEFIRSNLRLAASRLDKMSAIPERGFNVLKELRSYLRNARETVQNIGVAAARDIKLAHDRVAEYSRAAAAAAKNARLACLGQAQEVRAVDAPDTPVKGSPDIPKRAAPDRIAGSGTFFFKGIGTRRIGEPEVEMLRSTGVKDNNFVARSFIDGKFSPSRQLKPASTGAAATTAVSSGLGCFSLRLFAFNADRACDPVHGVKTLSAAGANVRMTTIGVDPFEDFTANAGANTATSIDKDVVCEGIPGPTCACILTCNLANACGPGEVCVTLTCKDPGANTCTEKLTRP